MQKETNLENVTNAESKKEPRLFFDFLFLRHSTANDARNIAEHLKKADIYAQELNTPKARVEKAEEFLNRLSRGDITIEEYETSMEIDRLFSDYDHELNKAIHRSGKHMVLADIKEDETKSSLEDLHLRILFSEIGKTIEIGDLRTSMTAAKQITQRIVENETVGREKLFIEHLKNKIRKLIAEDPILTQKEEVRTLITFGVAHLNLYHKLRLDPELKQAKLSRNFNRSATFWYSHYMQAIQRIIWNKEINDELLAKVVMELLLVSELYKQGHPNREDEDDEKITNITRKLSLQSIQEIFNKIAEKNKSTSVILKDYGIDISVI